jgi:regulator of replication initiation timing
MTTPSLYIRQLCFTGPGKAPAGVTFERGLNVIYGASDTGKSFILEAIDFMLGGQTQLRDIPERVGYDRVALAMETSDGDTFTLFRAASGGQFQLIDGIHQTLPTDAVPKVLGSKHSADNPNTISSYLLRRIGLQDRRIRIKKSNETNNLSFRNLSQLCLVNEGEIQKQRSPIEGGQVMHRTRELAVFKLLLTGVDDSTVVSTSRDNAVNQSVSAKLDFVDELLASYREKIGNPDAGEEELHDQISRLDAALEQDQQSLSASEAHYQALVEQRTDLRNRAQRGAERRAEIGEMLARFRLLDEHYRSDLGRLEGMQEAGSLISALSPGACPLCGADPEHQSQSSECDGNVDVVVAAAAAESAKIERLRRELADTVSQLGKEAQSFDRLLPRLHEKLDELDRQIQVQTPELHNLRSTYTELVEKRASIKAELSLREQIADLQARRDTLERASEIETNLTNNTTELPSSALDKFAQQVEALLKAWHFPEAERVYFEEATRDLVIAGKRRGSRGKGMRAITHAAFTIGLLEFCQSEKKPHPGFVVLDSPLLAYREPDGMEDDLRGTDVQEKFYAYLTKWTDRQAIIIENVNPPADIRSQDTSHFFSKNPHKERYGLFPPIS